MLAEQSELSGRLEREKRELAQKLEKEAKQGADE